MPERIAGPTVIESAGNLPKRIEEYVGRVNTGDGGLSIARMRSRQGWEEPAQTPEFDEYTLVLSGSLRIDHDGGSTDVSAGQAILTSAGERIRYSTLAACEYIAVCLPAFTPGRVQREDE